MTTTHDDYPHPVPSLAWLRWKENWLFVVMAPEQHVYGVIHVNAEPAFDRVRFTSNLSVRDRIYKHAGESRFPADWETCRELGDSGVRVTFTKPHEHFEVNISTATLDAELRFQQRRPTFDFAACRSAAPENLSFRDLMTLGTNLPHEHHQQALSVRGTVQVKDAQSPVRITLDGLGYRDHSWCMRGDHLIAQHTFSGLLFTNRAIGVKTARMMSRQATWAAEGYVSDDDGERALRTIDVGIESAGPDGLGGIVRFTLRDVYGTAYTIAADISKRLAHVPLISEKPGSAAGYRIVENLCPITCLETGESGLGHVELGLNPALAKP